jgi:SAM-dependent methyltransferase
MGYSLQNIENATATAPRSVEWEETPCLLCNGNNWLPLLEARDQVPGSAGLWFAVVQCQDCGLCFTNPRPTPESITRFYPDAYKPHDLPRNRRSSRGWTSWRWRKTKAGQERKVLAWHGEGRLLDFGCGGGSYLQRMHRQGWQVTGLDASSRAVQRIRSGLGLHALTGSLPHPGLEDGSFDVITMWQSLEHVHRPLEVLRAAYRLLVPGGKLIVSVPNIDSLPFRWFGQAWYALDLPRHLTHFAPWTLRLILQKAGFQMGTVEMIGHSSWLRASARQACAMQREQSGKLRWLRTRLASSLTAWYTRWTGQSDCMMATAYRRRDEI